MEEEIKKEGEASEDQTKGQEGAEKNAREAD